MKYLFVALLSLPMALVDVSARGLVNPTGQTTTQKTVAPQPDDMLDLDQAFADHLQAIITASEGMKNQVYMDFTNECVYAEMLLSMVAGYTKSDLSGSFTPSNRALTSRIRNLSSQVNALISEAQQLRSACGSDDNGAGGNDKCCKRAADAATSDTCQSAKSMNCKLVGNGVKGCSAASDDCK